MPSSNNLWHKHKWIRVAPRISSNLHQSQFLGLLFRRENRNQNRRSWKCPRVKLYRWRLWLMRNSSRSWSNRLLCRSSRQRMKLRRLHNIRTKHLLYSSHKSYNKISLWIRLYHHRAPSNLFHLIRIKLDRLENPIKIIKPILREGIIIESKSCLSNSSCTFASKSTFRDTATSPVVIQERKEIASCRSRTWWPTATSPSCRSQTPSRAVARCCRTRVTSAPRASNRHSSSSYSSTASAKVNHLTTRSSSPGATPSVAMIRTIMLKTSTLETSQAATFRHRKSLCYITNNSSKTSNSKTNRINQESMMELL